MQSFAKVNSQTVNLSESNAPLRSIFKEIQKQTGYSFLYAYELVESAGKVTVKVKNATLQQALEDVLDGKPLSYSILDQTVVVKPQLNKIVTHSQIETPELPEVDIRGKVTDENGNPLEGVSVTVKGSTEGTSTNSKGEYILNNIDENGTLLFSMVGYASQEARINKRNQINIHLVLDILQSENIVVASTGYQTISKERATGSFDIINSGQLSNPSTNIASRIVGQAAGVQATMDVNGNPAFEIRGQTSLYASSTPLIVVDGFAINGDFNSINPNDVESVTILKDAAAASIWGARSANGVIVITTKSAKKGTPLKVDLNVFSRIGKKFDLDYVNPLASSREIVDFEKFLFSKDWTPFINTGSFNNAVSQLSPASMALNEYKLGYISESEMNSILEPLKNLDNRKQISDHLLSNPVNNQINLNVYGGGERMSNSFSLLYESNQSNFTKTYNNRYMLNYRSSTKVFRWLDFNLAAQVQYNDIQNSGVGLSDIKSLAPYDMLLDNEGAFTNINRYYLPVLKRDVPTQLFPYTDWNYNPIQEIHNRDFSTKQINLRLQGGFTFQIMKGVSFDSKIQYENIGRENRNLYNDKTFYVRSTVNHSTTFDRATNKLTPNLPKGSILAQSKQDIQAYNFRNQLNINRTFLAKHEISFAGGTEINDIVSKSNGYPTTYGYNDETLVVGTFPNGPGGGFYQIKNWQGSNQTFSYVNSFTHNTDRYFSLYGNLSYIFNKKYTLSGSYRTDASNLITDDPKFRYEPFWSIGGGWNIVREDFLKDATWLNDLKIRVTYGYNGNVDKSTAFRPLIAMGSSTNIYTGDVTATISSFGNPTLRWERTGTWNLGVDFSIFNDKLYGKVDVYNKYGKDLIATLSIPAVNGTTSQKLNNAEMLNKGVEITLGTSIKLKGNDIVWRGGMNFSYNDNKIKNLFVANYPASSLYGGGTAAYVVGKNANTLWAFEYAGIRESDKQPLVKGAGKDLYDFGAFTPGDGREFMLDMGTKVAPYGFGFTSQFKIYDFDLSFVVTGKFGHVFKRQSFNYPFISGSRILPNSSLSDVMNGDPNKIVPMPLNDAEPRFYFWDRFYPYLDYLVVNASHLRMQEVNLTYNLPARMLQSLKLRGDIKIYVQGNNLFTMLANKYGEDPEYQKGFMKPMPQYTFGARFTF
jgi:TonB-linked SusC/RagA family outer membrane protein